jgi:hypothetical protein
VALLAFAPLMFADPAHASCVNSYESQVIAATELDINSTEAVVRTIETCGGDDVSYQVPLTTTVTFDGVEYSSVYATTNSVITFGQPDGTYWDYPSTPSISLYSMDWVVYPQWRNDEYLIIRSSDGGFQVEISARPIFLQSAPETTRINIVAAINADGTVAISYLMTGPDYSGYPWIRTGVRLNNGSVVTLADYGVVQVEEAPVLEPTPVEPTPEITEEVVRTEDTIRTQDVARTEEVVREPEPQPVPVEPVAPVAPEPTPEPEPALVEPVSPVEPLTPPVEESLQPEPTDPPVVPVEPEISPEPPVLPEPEQPQSFSEAVEAIGEAISQTFESAVEAIGEVVEAFQTAGLDMTQEERKTAQSVVVPSVIVAQIATMTFRK